MAEINDFNDFFKGGKGKKKPDIGNTKHPHKGKARGFVDKPRPGAGAAQHSGKTPIAEDGLEAMKSDGPTYPLAKSFNLVHYETDDHATAAAIEGGGLGQTSHRNLLMEREAAQQAQDEE